MPCKAHKTELCKESGAQNLSPVVQPGSCRAACQNAACQNAACQNAAPGGLQSHFGCLLPKQQQNDFHNVPRVRHGRSPCAGATPRITKTDNSPIWRVAAPYRCLVNKSRGQIRRKWMQPNFDVLRKVSACDDDRHFSKTLQFPHASKGLSGWLP